MTDLPASKPRRNPPPNGTRFERLVVIDNDAGRADGGNARLVLVRCDCGTEKTVRLSTLRDGRARSCGCLRADITRKRSIKHGASRTLGRNQGTSEYGTWAAMKSRCTNPNVPAFSDYGGRGIKVCDRWRESFEAFLQDVGHRPSPQHSLDRIDNDGNYEPGNVRWATRSQQTRNQRDNHFVTVDGQRMTLAEACARTGVAYATAWARIQRGWSVERALSAE